MKKTKMIMKIRMRKQSKKWKRRIDKKVENIMMIHIRLRGIRLIM